MYQLLVTTYVSIPGRGVACDTEVIIFDSMKQANLAAEQIPRTKGEVYYNVIKLYE